MNSNRLLRFALISAGVFAVALGGVYLYGPSGARNTVALNPVRSVAPLWVWALLFVASGAAVLLAAWRGSWLQAAYAMFGEAGMFVLWALGFAASAIQHDGLGLVGVLFAMTVAFNKILFATACIRESARAA